MTDKKFWDRGDIARFAKRAGVRYSNLHDILHRRRRVSPERALVLEKVFSRLFPKRPLITTWDWLFNTRTKHPAFYNRRKVK